MKKKKSDLGYPGSLTPNIDSKTWGGHRACSIVLPMQSLTKEAGPILKGRFRPIVKPQVQMKKPFTLNLCYLQAFDQQIYVLFRLLSITLHNRWHARTIDRSQKQGLPV